MTNKPQLTEGALTPEFIQELYSVAVSCEIAERSGAYMASFDLLCKADDAVGIAHVVRKLIDMVRANDVELQDLRRSCLALRGEIEDVQEQLYEAENRNNADDEELQERRKADSAEPVFFIEVEGDDWIQAGRIPGSTFNFNNLPDGINKLYAAPQPAPVVPVTLPCAVELKPGIIIGKGCKTETLLTALQRRADYYAEIDAMTPEERAEHNANIAAFKAMLPPSALDSKQVGELTMWVKRLAHSLRNARPDSKLHSDAMDYLCSNGLISVGDVLR